MIVLDTNVVSEAMRANPNPAVIAWLDRQGADTLYLTSTSLAELLVGVDIMPEGKRRSDLGDLLAALIADLFKSRILSFDDQAARRYAALITKARAAGRTISVADGQIAAIAELHGFAVATRDTHLFSAAPFSAAGLTVINPWIEVA